MNKTLFALRVRNLLVAIFFATASIISLLPVTANAATPDSLYSYDFQGETVVTPVANGAAANTSTPLNLVGDWSKSAFGVLFEGDKISKQSVGHANPSSGNTISVPATQAFGGAIMFKYDGPSAGTGCLGDSRNITQIGRFGAGLTQFKLQLSNCGTDSSNVYTECRVAGATTSTDVPLARSSQALVDGNVYIAQCAKSPDQVAGTTTVQLTTARVDTVNGNTVTVDSIQIPPTGALTSTAYLSVANKYALPPIASNSDQFTGEIAKLAYCGGATLVAAVACLELEVPSIPVAPPPDPTFIEYVTNPSLETDLTGWTGLATTASLNSRVSGGYDGSYSIRSINNSGAATKHGFTASPDWIDGTPGKATAAGLVYTASAWVKPDAIGQKISIYLRERNSSSTTIGSKTVTLTAASTNWQQITNAYTAIQTGNRLNYHVFATNTAPALGFNADLLSLTVPN